MKYLNLIAFIAVCLGLWGCEFQFDNKVDEINVNQKEDENDPIDTSVDFQTDIDDPDPWEWEDTVSPQEDTGTAIDTNYPDDTDTYVDTDVVDTAIIEDDTAIDIDTAFAEECEAGWRWHVNQCIRVIGEDLPTPNGMAIGNSTIYWSTSGATDGKILSLPQEGGEKTTVETGLSHPTQLIYGPVHYLYWVSAGTASGGNDKIMRVPVTKAGSPEIFYENTDGTPISGLTAGMNFVAWTYPKDDKFEVVFLPHDDSAVTEPLTVATEDHPVRSLSARLSDLYWIANSGEDTDIVKKVHGIYNFNPSTVYAIEEMRSAENILAFGLAYTTALVWVTEPSEGSLDVYFDNIKFETVEAADPLRIFFKDGFAFYMVQDTSPEQAGTYFMKRHHIDDLVIEQLDGPILFDRYNNWIYFVGDDIVEIPDPTA